MSYKCRKRYCKHTLENISVTYHLCTGFLAVHKAARNDSGRQQFVALPELLENDAAGEALTTDTNSLEHTIASQLVKHEGRFDFASLQPNTRQTFQKHSSNDKITLGLITLILITSETISSTPATTWFIIQLIQTVAGDVLLGSVTTNLREMRLTGLARKTSPYLLA